MTIEEVEALRKNDPVRYLELLSVVVDAAIKALKKQEPMKVKAHHLCPACGRDVTGSGWYCWNCGQRLDWNARGADHRCSLGEIGLKAVDMAIEALKEPETITLDYHEKCIFLAAMGKERRVCQEMDKEHVIKAKPLVPIVDSVERKVKAVLWGEKNE